MRLQEPNIPLKCSTNLTNMFCVECCKVAVIYIIYDPKKKIVVDKGSSRPCGDNHSQISIHAERISINYCRKYDKRNRYHIYIWRYNKKGTLKPIYCCNTCCKLVKKYNYHDKIFTFDEDKIYSAYGKPYLTLGYQIKNDL